MSEGNREMTDELRLVQRIQTGDEKAFRELVETYQQQVYYLALDLCGEHYQAEDISQDVFIKAFRGIGKFRSGAKLSTWLHRITVNTFIDSKRRKKHTTISMVTDDDDEETNVVELVADDGPDPERASGSKQISEHIDRALDSLSQQERTVFVMRHYHDMQLKEIADSLSLAEGTVKSLLFRSIRKLREKLAHYRDELGLEDSL